MTNPNGLLSAYKDRYRALNFQLRDMAETCKKSANFAKNFSVKKVLELMHKILLEATLKVEAMNRILTEPPPPLKTENDIVKHLSSGSNPIPTFTLAINAAQHRLEELDITSACRTAAKYEEILGRPKEYESLGRIYKTLAHILDNITTECLTFSKGWKPIRQGLREKFAAEKGLPLPEPLEDYSDVLLAKWNELPFKVEACFEGRSMDKSTLLIDFDVFKKVGKDWVKPQVRGASHKSQLPSVEDHFREIIDETPIPPHLERLGQMGLRTDASILWKDFKQLARSSLRNESLRIAFAGIVNHGKSSAINALLGRIVLRAD
ncbi:13628_t:CDS:1, partial [Acaulospora colombiana]